MPELCVFQPFEKLKPSYIPRCGIFSLQYETKTSDAGENEYYCMYYFVCDFQNFRTKKKIFSFFENEEYKIKIRQRKI